MHQFIDETDGGEKYDIRVWSKEFNIIKAVKNIDEALNENTQSFMKDFCHKLSSEFANVHSSFESDTLQNIF